MKKLINYLLLILFVLGIYYYLKTDNPCENLKELYGKSDFYIKIDTFYTDQRYLVIRGINDKSKPEEFRDVASYLFQKKYLFSKGDTLIKKKDELFFELRKFETGEKKIIEINCK